jgi:hypothetical protein
MLQRALTLSNFFTFTKWSKKNMWYLFIPAAVTAAKMILNARAKKKNKYPVGGRGKISYLCEKKPPFYSKRNFRFI